MIETQEQISQRFLAACYRTTRAILLCRHLLPTGQAIGLAIETEEIHRATSIDPASVLRDVEPWLRGLPAVPPTSITPEDAERLANAHGYVAVRLGYDPEDPCLFWLEPKHFLEFFPSTEELRIFEDSFLRVIAKTLIRRGAIAAMERMEKVLGKPSLYERRDWVALQRAYLRDFVSTNTEDDRQLMIMRLEKMFIDAEEALDVKARASILRTLAAVQGLTFQDAEKSSRELQILLSQQRPRDANLARLEGPSE